MAELPVHEITQVDHVNNHLLKAFKNHLDSGEGKLFENEHHTEEQDWSDDKDYTNASLAKDHPPELIRGEKDDDEHLHHGKGHKYGHHFHEGHDLHLDGEECHHEHHEENPEVHQNEEAPTEVVTSSEEVVQQTES